MPLEPDLRLRLEHLERDSRRWKWSSLALLAGFLSLLAVGFACPTAPVQAEHQVTAERFVLTGPGGEEYAVLGLDEEGRPQLLMRRGKASAFLTLAGPALMLRGADGKTGAFLGLDDRGTRLELTSANPLDGIRATVNPDGSAGVYALDRTGRERTSLESLAGGASQFTARDATGKIRAFFGLDGTDATSTLLLDSLGRRRIGMVLAPDGTPTLATEDGQGRLRTQLTMDRDGLPLFQLLREDGRPMFQAPK